MGSGESEAPGQSKAPERACHAGNTTRVSALLAAGAVVSDKVGCPLFIAIHRDNVKLASLLVARGAKVNQARETPVQGAPTQRITPLWAAILSGSAKLVSVLLLAADAAVNQAIEDGWTPLVYAMHRSNAEFISVLLAAGAVVNQAREDGTAPLFLAIEQGNAGLVHVLLEAGAAVNQAKEDGTTPLLLAIQQGNAELVSVLLEAGAAVNQAPHEPLAQTLVPLYSARLLWAAPTVPSCCPPTAPLAALTFRGSTFRWRRAKWQLTTATTPSPPGSSPARSGPRHSTTSRSSAPRAHAPGCATAPTWRRQMGRALRRSRWRARCSRRARRARVRRRAWCSTPPSHGVSRRTRSSLRRHAHAQWSSCC